MLAHFFVLAYAIGLTGDCCDSNIQLGITVKGKKVGSSESVIPPVGESIFSSPVWLQP